MAVESAWHVQCVTISSNDMQTTCDHSLSSNMYMSKYLTSTQAFMIFSLASCEAFHTCSMPRLGVASRACFWDLTRRHIELRRMPQDVLRYAAKGIDARLQVQQNEEMKRISVTL